MKKRSDTPRAYPEKFSTKTFTKGNKLNKLQVHLVSALEHVKEKSVKLSKFERMMFSSVAVFIFIIFAGLLVSGLINAAYPYAPSGGIVVTSIGANIPENTVVSFNLASCPVGWTLADGTSGTPDLTNMSVNGEQVMKQYYANSSDGPGSFNVTATNWITEKAVAIPYQTSDGSWRLKFNVQGDFSDGPASRDVTFSGVIFNSDYYQTFAVSHREANDLDIVGIANQGTNYTTVGFSTAGANNDIMFSGDVELDSKPDWADADASLIYCSKTAEDSTASNSIWNVVGGLITPVNVSADFAINNSDLYVNTTSGNVGIGTDNIEATTKLKVEGNLNVTGNFSVGGDMIIGKANSSDVTTGTDDTKFATPAALENARIAFTGKSTSDQNSITSGDQIVFVEQFDVGGNFASNQFTVPVTGYYHITASILLANINDGAQYAMNIDKGGVNQYQAIWEPQATGGTAADTFQLTHSLVMNLTAADVIDITVDAESGTPHILTDSYFSGYRIM